MKEDKILQEIREIKERLVEIERIVLSKKSKPISTSQNYQSLSGGVRFLINQGFFNKLRSLNEVISELQKEGYYFPKESVSTCLIRDFVKRSKMLQRINEEKRWKYVLRK